MNAQDLIIQKRAAQLAYATSSKEAALAMLVAYRMEEQAIMAEERGNPEQAQFFRTGCPISMGYLRQEKLLQNTQTSYEFTFQESPNAEPYEQLLSTNDVFFITGISVAIVRRIDARKSAGFRYNYPDPIVFAAAGEAEGINTIFQSGKLKATFNNNLIIPAMDLDRFRHAKNVEGLGGDGTNQYVYRVTTATPTVNFPIQFDGGNDGFVETPQLPVLSGKNTNSFNISYPGYSGIQVAGPANQANKLCVYLRGFLVSGAARSLVV